MTPVERETALLARIRGRVQGVGFRATTVERATGLGLLGWVRNEDDGSVLVHAEGAADAIEALRTFLAQGASGASVEAVDELPAKVEGHEQFAIRGVAAGRFEVAADAGEDGRTSYVLALDVDGAPRRWRLAKPPSMVPADKRSATELAETDDGGVGVAWDAGPYEQGGRVAWPEAIERGHAVFVLHGDRLRGGFALQRTRGEGPGSGWLLIKRRDPFAETR